MAIDTQSTMNIFPDTVYFPQTLDSPIFLWQISNQTSQVSLRIHECLIKAATYRQVWIYFYMNI